MKLRTKDLLYGAVLTSVSLMIPLFFRGWLQVVIPPFSATLGSHVPVLLAMFVSPITAALVGVGSTIGFFITLGPVVAARASTHIIFPTIGALLLQRGMKPWQVMLLIAPIHALGEALVVIPFGFSLQSSLIVVGVGTLLHHSADAIITLALHGSLARAGLRLTTKVSE